MQIEKKNLNPLAGEFVYIRCRRRDIFIFKVICFWCVVCGKMLNLVDINTFTLTWAPVDQLLATRPVNQGLWVRTPAQLTLLPRFDKSHCDKRSSSSTNGLTVYAEKQPVALKVRCVKYWYEWINQSLPLLGVLLFNKLECSLKLETIIFK